MCAKSQMVQKFKVQLLTAYQMFCQVGIYSGKAKLAFYNGDFFQGLKINYFAKFG